MEITILLFGVLKDIIQENSLKKQLEGNTSIGDLKAQLFEEYDKLNSFSNFSVAVNEEYVTADHLLKNNDVVALIPPVSGG